MLILLWGLRSVPGHSWALGCWPGLISQSHLNPKLGVGVWSLQSRTNPSLGPVASLGVDIKEGDTETRMAAHVRCE